MELECKAWFLRCLWIKMVCDSLDKSEQGYSRRGLCQERHGGFEFGNEWRECLESLKLMTSVISPQPTML